MKFSVLLPVYKNDNPLYLKEAIDSLLNQTLKANEIVVVVDGKIDKKLDNILLSFGNELSIYYFEENRGLGLVLADGINLCKYDWIARMDADDICIIDRFEKQIKYIEENPEIDVLGGQIDEFDGDKGNVTGSRIVPVSHTEIIKFMKYRNPFNHMTVILKKQSVLESGNYEHMNGFEDYYLWFKMYNNGGRFVNLDNKFVLARCGNEMISRRGGSSYIKSEKIFLKQIFKRNYITKFEYVKNRILRSIVRLMPSMMLRKFYEKILRRNN